MQGLIRGGSEALSAVLRNSPDELDLTPYAGRWVALVRGGVAGVGRTSEEARRAAQLSRPKEKPELRFVTVDDWQSLPILQRLWHLITRQNVEALLVGGAVRDGLLGRPVHDLDFVVDGDATALAASVSRALGGALVLLDQERDIARVVVWQAGRRFYLDFARRQGERWDADLRARDFTVNAIAIGPGGRYLDPLRGRGDLAAGQLRATNAGAFRDDPLRTLRAVRLHAELGLDIEEKTFQWIQRDAPLLPRAAAERIRDELVRILGAQDAACHLATLDDLGLLTQVMPELMATKGVEQSPPHQWDVWSHTRMTVEAVEGLLGSLAGKYAKGDNLSVPGWAWGDLVKRLGSLQSDLIAHLSRVVSDTRDRGFAIKLSALLHDVGKPQTSSVDEDGRIHFYNHEKIGAELTAERLRALRFSGSETVLVHTIVLHHLRPGHLARTRGPTRRAIYRYFKALGGAGVEVALLSLADMLATWGPALPSQRWLRRLDVVATLLTAYFDNSETVTPLPLINGDELMAALRLSPGPEVGRLLEAVREAQATGEVTSREEALTLAEKLKRES
jgi:putative nucleotidyltransferase with HDIG domain